MPVTRKRTAIWATSAGLLLAAGLSACSSSGGASPGSAAAGTGASTAAKLDSALHNSLPASVKSKGLTLATDPTEPPLEFNDSSNKLVGAEVDLANAIGQVLGVKVHLVSASFDTIIPGIQAGRYDASVSGFADRSDRQKVVDFVDYFRTGEAFLVKSGTQKTLETMTDLCGKSVAIAKGTTMVDEVAGQSKTCTAAGKSAIKSSVYPNTDDGVLAAQSGRADLSLLTNLDALWVAKNSHGVMDVVGHPTGGKDINGIAVKKGSGLTEPIHQAIQQLMNSGRFTQIFTKWGLGAVALKKATVNAGA